MIGLLPLASNVGLVRHLASSAYPYGLCIDGVDVIAKVDYASIQITENGSGGVSSMRFSILDSTVSVLIADSAEVRMWDYLRDMPMFLGFIEQVTYTRWAAVGRTIEVSCYGIEALLDTTIIPSMTRTAYQTDDQTNGMTADVVLQVLASYTGLRTGKDVILSTSASSRTMPIADTFEYYMSYTPSVTLDGMTVRNAIQAYMDACNLSTPDPIPMFLSVDFRRGVRFWSWLGNWSTVTFASFPAPPSDYTTLTIDSTTGGALAATDIRYSIDTSPNTIINAVYVNGNSPEGSGWVVGDTSTGRREAYVTSNSTNEFMRSAAALATLGNKTKAAGRGTLTLENFVPIDAHPGGKLVISDAAFGWTNQKALITQIDKSISNKVTGTQNWTVSYVLISHGPSAGRARASQYRRTITRGTLN